MTDEITAAAIASVRAAGEDVIRTLRELAIFELPSRPYLPPPFDVAAERSCLEALLLGRRRPAELACKAPDFYVPAHAGIVAVVEALEEAGRLDGRPSPKAIVSVLARQGTDREHAAQLLVDITDDEPMRADVDELAEQVHELAARRRMIATMQKLDAIWRCGAEAPSELLGELGEMITRWSR